MNIPACPNAASGWPSPRRTARHGRALPGRAHRDGGAPAQVQRVLKSSHGALWHFERARSRTRIHVAPVREPRHGRPLPGRAHKDNRSTCASTACPGTQPLGTGTRTRLRARGGAQSNAHSRGSSKRALTTNPRSRRWASYALKQEEETIASRAYVQSRRPPRGEGGGPVVQGHGR